MFGKPTPPPRPKKAIRFDKTEWDRQVTGPMMQELEQSTGLAARQLESLLSDFKEAAGGGGGGGVGPSADNDNEGSFRLNKTQFETIWQRVGPAGTGTLAPMVFNAIDTDGDGRVNFQDVIYGIKMAAPDAVLDKMAWALKLYEATGVGTVAYPKVTDIAADVIRLSQQRPAPAGSRAEVEWRARAAADFVGAFMGYDATSRSIDVSSLVSAVETAAAFYKQTGGLGAPKF